MLIRGLYFLDIHPSLSLVTCKIRTQAFHKQLSIQMVSNLGKKNLIIFGYGNFRYYFELKLLEIFPDRKWIFQINGLQCYFVSQKVAHNQKYLQNNAKISTNLHIQGKLWEGRNTVITFVKRSTVRKLILCCFFSRISCQSDLDYSWKVETNNVSQAP